MTKLVVSLPHRAVLSISGEDRRTFLQGLVSNDVNKVSPGQAIHAAFLTPQGKFLHEFFIIEIGDSLFLDTERERIGDLKKRLSLYKLRSKVQIDLAEGMAVAALIGEDAATAFGLAGAGQATSLGSGAVFIDPRLAEAGLRVIAPASDLEKLAAEGFGQGDFAAWDQLRLAQGLPDGSRDMEIEKAILLENGFDELGSVDFKKGCYMGQELTARTKWRALIKKRLLPVEIDGPIPQPGAPILLGEAEAGEMRSASGKVGLALIRVEAFDKVVAGEGSLISGESRLSPRKPGWVQFQKPAS